MKFLVIFLSLVLGNAFSAIFASRIPQPEIPAPPQPPSERQGRGVPAHGPASSANVVAAPQPPISPNVPMSPNRPSDNEMNVPWCADYNNCGQRQLCNGPICPEGFTCCRSLEGVCCQETYASPRHERAPYQPQPNVPHNRSPYPPPTTLQLPQTIPIKENKLTIPIPLPGVSYNGSLDYNKTHYYPFILDLSSLNLPPNFRPVNFVLRSVSVSPRTETEYKEEYESSSPVDEMPIRMAYPRSPESMYSYPEPSRYYKIRGSPFAPPRDSTPQYDPYYSAPPRDSTPPYDPYYSAPQPTYIPRPQSRPEVYQPPAPRYEEPEPVYRYEQPPAGEQINPVTGERIFPSTYQRSYRSYEPVYYRIMPQYRRLRTPRDPIY